MTIKLNWQKLKDEHLKEDEEWEAAIFYGHYLYLSHNGDDEDGGWFNVALFDQYGNERDGVCGGKTIDEAKSSAEKWLVEQCKEFLV